MSNNTEKKTGKVGKVARLTARYVFAGVVLAGVGAVAALGTAVGANLARKI